MPFSVSKMDHKTECESLVVTNSLIIHLLCISLSSVEHFQTPCLGFAALLSWFTLRPLIWYEFFLSQPAAAFRRKMLWKLQLPDSEQLQQVILVEHFGAQQPDISLTGRRPKIEFKGRIFARCPETLHENQCNEKLDLVFCVPLLTAVELHCAYVYLAIVKKVAFTTPKLKCAQR